MSKGLPPPNHTQTPNIFFDESLAKIKSFAELKVILAVIRQTFGWHKDSDKLSHSQLAKTTGLTRRGTINGIERALEEGYLEREPSGQSFTYRLALVNIEAPVNEVSSEPTSPELVNVVHQQLVNQVGTQKKGKKKVKKEEGAQAQPGGTVLSGIALLRDVAQAFPPKESWPRYLEILGENVDEAKLRKCRAEWVDRGYNKVSWKWFTEWYVEGMPERNGRTATATAARTYEWQGRYYAYGETISDDGTRFTVMGSDGTPTKRWHTLEAYAEDRGLTMEQARHGMNA